MSQFTELSKTVLNASYVVVDGLEVSGFPLRAPDGSAAAPSYSFAAASNTGMFRATTGGEVMMSNAGQAMFGAGPGGTTVLAGPPPVSWAGGEGVTFINPVITTPTLGGPGSGVLWVDGTDLKAYNIVGSTFTLTALASDLVGPAGATANNGVLFDGTTGKLVKDSTLVVDVVNSQLELDATAAPGAPRYTFAGDTTSGLYLAAANTLGVATGGVLQLSATSTAVVAVPPTQVAAGTVAAPGLAFSGVTDAGLVGVTGDGVGVVESGTVGLAVDGDAVTVGGGPIGVGGGVGVLAMATATTVPTGATTGGISLYVEGTTLKAMTTASATPVDLTACVEGPGSAVTDNAVVRFDGTTGSIVQDTPNVVVANTGEVRLPAGSAGAPTYTFDGDTSTGLFAPAANTVGITTGGVTRVTLDATQVVSTVPWGVADGVVSAPGLSFSGDTNTGVFRTAAGAVGLVGGSGEAIVAAANANVALGLETTDFGGGSGVVFVSQALTNPTLSPVGGGVLYVDAAAVDNLTYRDTTGTDTVLSSKLAGPASAADRAIARWDGTSGNVVQSSSVTVTATNRVRAPTGLVSAPTYSFSGDSNTGLTAAGGVATLVAGGTGTLALSTSALTSSGQVQVLAGTAGAPGLAVESAPTNGLFAASATSVGVTTNGTGAAVVEVAGTRANVTWGSVNTNYGGGEGVVLLEDVGGGAPAGTLTSGGVLYVTGTDLRFLNDAGADVSLLTTVTGPGSSTDTALVRWDGTSGLVMQDSAMLASATETLATANGSAAAPMYTFSGTTNTGMYRVGTNSLAITAGGTDTITFTSSTVTVPTAPLQADDGLRVGGASGVNYSVSGAVATINALTAGTGALTWANTTGSIFNTTAGGNLAFVNDLVFTEAASTFTVGHDGSDYVWSVATGAPFWALTVTGSAVLSGTSGTNDGVEITPITTITGQVLVGDGTNTQKGLCSRRTGGGATNNRGIGIDDTSIVFGLGSTSGVHIHNNGNVLWSQTNFSTTFTTTNAVWVYDDTSGAARTPSATNVLLFLENTTSAGDGYMCTVNSGANKDCLDGPRKRATATKSSVSIADNTSTNTDTATWTVVNENAMASSPTDGRFALDDDCFVKVVATASWAANATGYRRLSIMNRAGAVYTVLNEVVQNATSGTVTTDQTVTYFGTLTNPDAITVQVQQTSGGNLNVDLSVSVLRYASNE